ncbi:HAD-IA family hydrolase [Hyphobacterium marinum]|uniref:Phosphoglycolate phosphatase n=1 Tax=Hyphobacterium marinum TaxID=3116574 RepID=A0ABU7M0R0_9PROT|nr:HAD-IA family hydrolase [Hyphobacterium sp. Y6023]MEE2567286.1 HAD-IA family hydrolase [Hyphobacterium sp. Y6023]
MSDCFKGAGIAFDLDGTLVDTAPDLVRALNAVIAEDGLAPIPVGDVRMMVGRGARVLIERAYAVQGVPLKSDAIDPHVARFIDVYREGIADLSRPFDGCIDLLDELQARGSRLSVCTNKPSELADLLIAELGLSQYFERIIGPERTPAKKPDAAHFLSAVADAGPKLAMVGDSEPDVTCARAAGVPVILMAHGYSEIPAGALGADRLLDQFSDLPGALEALWADPD